MPLTTSPCSRCETIRETQVTSTHEVLCPVCYLRRFANCGGCGAELDRSHRATIDGNGQMFCSPCADNQCVRCVGCDTRTSPAHVIRLADGNTWCARCYDENFRECDECEQTTSISDLEGGVCHGCNDRVIHRWEHHGFFVEEPTTVELKSDRKFGVEIETSACPDHSSIRNNTVFGCKPDGSVDGMEFVSPILYGDEGLGEIRKICTHARRLNWEIDSACGLHLHVDLTGESDEDCFKLAYAYMHTYDFWTSFISESRKQNYYCAKHTYTDADILRNNTFGDWCHFASNGERYNWCNWYAWLQHKTVELRHHTATLNENKICNWVKAHTRFIDKVLTLPQVTLTRSLAGRDIHAQSVAISQWWDDEELTEYYKGRAAHFQKPFRPATLIGA